jgi:hypothetical protein
MLHSGEPTAALFGTVRPGLKGLPGTNTLAYLDSSSVVSKNAIQYLDLGPML